MNESLLGEDPARALSAVGHVMQLRQVLEERADGVLWAASAEQRRGALAELVEAVQSAVSGRAPRLRAVRRQRESEPTTEGR